MSEPYNKFLNRRSYRASLNEIFNEYEWSLNSKYLSDKLNNKENVLSANKSLKRDIQDKLAFRKGFDFPEKYLHG